MAGHEAYLEFPDNRKAFALKQADLVDAESGVPYTRRSTGGNSGQFRKATLLIRLSRVLTDDSIQLVWMVKMMESSPCNAAKPHSILLHSRLRRECRSIE